MSKNRKQILWLLFIALVACIGILTYLTVERLSESRRKPTETRQPTPAGTEAPVEKWGGTHYYAEMPRPQSYQDAILVLTNIGYVVGYSERRKNPAWVCYRTFKAGLQAPPRPDSFKVDARTRARVSSADYTGSGYDRGHMAPNFAIAVCYGKGAQLETFLMSNIIPQKPKLNREVWENIERTEIREWSQQFGDVWVITGPIFDSNPKTLSNGVQIPSACFRINVCEQDGNLRILAFIIPQDVMGNEPPSRFLTSVDRIESETGLDFLSQLPDELENAIEAETAKALW